MKPLNVLEICSGTQGLKNAYERSKIPQQLCDFIVEYCENKLCKE